MNVPKGCCFIFLVLLFGQIRANIDSKEYFCGKKLVRTLTELCSIYNNPTFARNRFRRQIVEECCRSQCSRRYLVQYYCLEANSSIAHLLKLKPENSSKAAHEKDQRTNEKGDRSLPVGSTENTLQSKNQPLSSNHNRIDTHGTRNCKCRKRRAKRIKKMKRMQSPRNMIHNTVPAANIGHVEQFQSPFYVWKFSRMY